MHYNNNSGERPPADPQLLKVMHEVIIKVLMEDPRTMPLNVLKTKTYRAVKETIPNIYIKDEDFLGVVEKLKSESLIGQNKFNKFFVDYLDYPAGTVTGQGFLEIDKTKGNGFITIKKDVNEFKKSSHFVHKKNLNDAQNGDYVEYVELIVNNQKNFSKFALIDARVLKILDKPTVTNS